MNREEILKKYKISESTLKNWKKLNYIENINEIDPIIIDNIMSSKVSNRRNKRNSSSKIIPISYVKDARIIDIIKDIKPGVQVCDSTRLIDDKIVDSLAMITLVAELSDEFDVEITARDIVPENFETPAAIKQMIERLEDED